MEDLRRKALSILSTRHHIKHGHWLLYHNLEFPIADAIQRAAISYMMLTGTNRNPHFGQRQSPQLRVAVSCVDDDVMSILDHLMGVNPWDRCKFESRCFEIHCIPSVFLWLDPTTSYSTERGTVSGFSEDLSGIWMGNTDLMDEATAVHAHSKGDQPISRQQDGISHAERATRQRARDVVKVLRQLEHNEIERIIREASVTS